ncbi:MAG TPA: tripartite tricarboxylate transporter substrate-binding protein [Vicinamibacterales bacterium]|jgi:putative tricarboxylic transport membrane protein|nr:tripartite tricarboxylate transporter substrate-binding protein [Vicinamibacterales bacterium]
MTRQMSAALVWVAVVAWAAGAAAQPAVDELRIIAPAAPGGGWDQTARVMQTALQRAGLVRIAPVENVPGAAGTIGLARFIGAEAGRRDVVMVSGLIMLGGIVTHHAPVTLHDVTLLARLTGEYEVIAVPATSPFRTLRDLLDAFTARPESISWGGGSAGGSDQILAGLVADAVGVSPSRVNYIAFSGGGESLAAILGGQVSVGVNGLAEFAPQIEAGTLRPLAISSAERLPGVEVPTLREQGLAIDFENWRSLVAPPGVAPADRARLDSLIAAMVVSPAWRESLARYRWLDRYLTGDAFLQFAAAEETRVRDVLRKFAAGQESSRTSPEPYPWLVIAGLLVTGALLARQIVRSGRGQSAEGSGRAPVALLAAAAVLHLLLLERAGFVLAAAVLFWLAARAFDPRHPVRDGMFAVGVSVSTYLLFAHVLHLSLPAGLLAGWL